MPRTLQKKAKNGIKRIVLRQYRKSRALRGPKEERLEAVAERIADGLLDDALLAIVQKGKRGAQSPEFREKLQEQIKQKCEAEAHKYAAVTSAKNAMGALGIRKGRREHFNLIERTISRTLLRIESGAIVKGKKVTDTFIGQLEAESVKRIGKEKSNRLITLAAKNYVKISGVLEDKILQSFFYRLGDQRQRMSVLGIE